MCLAIPGKIITIEPHDEASPVGPFATVDFQGSRTEVCLTMTPEAVPGDWVIVHAGFALKILTEDDARQTWQYLKQADFTPPAELSQS